MEHVSHLRAELLRFFKRAPLPEPAPETVPQVRNMDAVYIRWMIRADLPAVLAIEREAFEFPWTEAEYIECMRRRNTVGYVAEVNGVIVGLLLSELHKKYFRILNIAVAAASRRQGVGTQMIESVKQKLTPERRSLIELEVRETNLIAQVFFRACGLKAVDMLDDWFLDSDEAAYVFRYGMEGL